MHSQTSRPPIRRLFIDRCLQFLKPGARLLARSREKVVEQLTIHRHYRSATNSLALPVGKKGAVLASLFKPGCRPRVIQPRPPSGFAFSLADFSRQLLTEPVRYSTEKAALKQGPMSGKRRLRGQFLPLDHIRRSWSMNCHGGSPACRMAANKRSWFGVRR